jgi:NADH-quinone oxidoreductase subunit N
MLVGLAMGAGAAAVDGIPALWFYMAAYAAVTIGVFALISAASVDRPLVADSDLTGLSQTHPTIAMALAICLFSLIGLPPTAGFTGKLELFWASWSSSSAWGRPLAAAIAANAAVAAWYYLRLVAIMYRDPPAGESTRRIALAPALAGGAAAVATLVVFALPQRLWDLAEMVIR